MAARPDDHRNQSAESLYESIYAVVRRIPRGRVATYGQVAALAGLGRRARQVGYALSVLSEGSDVPWQRVINAKGEVSARAYPGSGPWEGFQRHLLEEEGVTFDSKGRIDLRRFRWEPPLERRRDGGDQAETAALRKRLKKSLSDPSGS